MNKQLYNFILDKGHHQYRRRADFDLAAIYSQKGISPTERMCDRFEKMCDAEQAVILDGEQTVFLRTVENLKSIEKLIGKSDWERLPYNSMAGAKYASLGLKYGLQARGASDFLPKTKG